MVIRMNENNIKDNTQPQQKQQEMPAQTTAVPQNTQPQQVAQTTESTNFNDFATKKVINFETTPIVDIVNYILVTAAKKNTSDIHFDPAENHMKVRFRIDGKLDTFTIVPNTAKQNLVARLKILSGMNITETRLPQDGAIRTTIEGIVYVCF